MATARAAAVALVVVTAGVVAALLGGLSTLQAGDLICTQFGGGPPYAFETYEATRDRVPYLRAQALAAQNLLLPDDANFRLPEILVGAAEEREPDPSALIPTELLHAIGWIESSLNQAAILVPYESTGDVLLSPSCAYGLMQVASFFSNNGDVPSRGESLAGTHYAYNIAAGAQILVEKWNSDFFPLVGKSDPRFLESWYYATWAYNGWALVNHPAGPDVDPFRQTPYPCEGPFNGYPYQELVFGCFANPPRVDGAPLWAPLPFLMPDLAQLAGEGGPLSTEAFFEGWSALRTAPFSGEETGRPFAAMNLALPPKAAPVATPPIGGAVAAAQRAQIFGSPVLVLDQTTFELKVTDEDIPTASITIGNAGRGLLVYRLVPSVAWLQASVVAGIAIGTDLPVRAGAARNASVRIELLGDGLAEGLHQGTITVEVLLPDGRVVRETVVVVVDKQGVPRYEAGTPLS